MPKLKSIRKKYRQKKKKAQKAQKALAKTMKKMLSTAVSKDLDT